MASQALPDALGVTRPLASPLYTASVYTIPDLDALEQILDGGQPGFCYARDAHPNAHRLAAKLAEAEAADWAVICSSGMAAISAIFTSSLSSGDRVVASNRLYGRTTQLLSLELARFGVATDYIDTTDLESVASALDRPAKLLFVETISNPLLRLADLDALAKLAHARGALLVVDNTFATPSLCRPLEHGADLVMESLTKMIAGHSDVTLGLLAGKGDTQMGRACSIWGFTANPFDCWMTERGLSTLDLRMQAASANASALANWLVEQPSVSRVAYPGRHDHPDRELAGRLLDGAFGNMLAFELVGGRAAVNQFMRQAPGIPFSPSLGDTMTTCSYPTGTSHRYTSSEEKQKQGITEGLIRLSVGIENQELIRQQLLKGFAGTATSSAAPALAHV